MSVQFGKHTITDEEGVQLVMKAAHAVLQVALTHQKERAAQEKGSSFFNFFKPNVPEQTTLKPSALSSPSSRSRSKK